MTLQVQHPVADWYLAFDDLWELMRVNWHTHNTFTQSGMWDAGEYTVRGILMVVDSSPYRGVLLHINRGGEDDYMVVVTYGPKCNECGYTPYNALGYGSDEADGLLVWAARTIDELIDNANENGVERLHDDGCSHLRYPDEEATDGD